MNIKFSKRLKNNSSSKYNKFMQLKQKAIDLKNKGVNVIDFTIGDPTESTDPNVVKEIGGKALLRANSGYPMYTGELKFKKDCAKYMLREHNTSLTPETEICITNGAKDAISHFSLSIIDEGDLVICPVPGYPPYVSSTEDAGGKVYLVPLLEEKEFLIDIDAIPKNVAQEAKVIWINYPNSPTGVNAPKWWYDKLIKWAQKYNILIAADEGCYIDLSYKSKEKPLSIFEVKKDKKGIIAFYSLSKRSNMTGYRVGFVCGDSEIISNYKTIQNRRTGGTPTFIQDLASIALENNNFTNSMVEKYTQKKEIILKALKSIALSTPDPDTAFYIWQKTPKDITGIEFAEQLLEKGIMVTPGEFLSKEIHGINPGSNYIRFALVPETEEVKMAGEIIQRLKKLKPKP